MRKIWVILILVFSVFVGLCGQDDLAKRLAEAGDSSQFKGSPYLVVFDRTEVRVMDSGLSHVNRETFYKVLTGKGAEQLKAVTFDYDPQSAYIEIKEAKIVKKEGEVKELPPASVKDYPAPARAIYWGAREKMLPVGRLEPGDGLWVKTYRKGFTYALLLDGEDDKYIPPMRGHFYDIVPFYSRVPINCKTYEVILPIDKKLQFELYNGEARHFAHTQGQEVHYFWEKRDILPFKSEPNMVSRSDVAPKLLLSTSPDWKAKSLWFHKVNEDFGSFEYDEEISRKVAEIVEGAKDDWDKISRLTHWVAEEIRYSGISMGEGEGYTLHRGTMTFRDRCGVCKDKAGMLVTMLRAAGFTSYPAMTMAGSRIDRIPADQFNHCVTLVKMEGKYHLLDPTWVPGVRELWSSAEQQQEYLMGVPEGADLKSTPLSPSKNHYLIADIRSRIDKQGNLTASISVEAEGQTDSSLRRGFSRRMRNQWNQTLEREFFGLAPDARISNLVYQDPVDISRPFKISFDVAIPRHLQEGKDAHYLTPVSSILPFSRVLSFYYMDIDLKERKHPFRTRSSQWAKVIETLRLPAGYKCVNPPRFDKIEGSGADFNGSFKQRGSTIRIEKSISMKKRIYQPEDWQSFRASVLEFKKPGENILILRKGGTR